MSKDTDFSKVHVLGYSSDFDSESETKKRRLQHDNLKVKKAKCSSGVASYQEAQEQSLQEERKIHRFHALSQSAYDRHKMLVNNYMLYFGGKLADFTRDVRMDRNDMDVIHDNHQFVWDEGDDNKRNWEKRLAKKYYDKLYKEYCLADLSLYKSNKVGMRWRTEAEVIDGKGQFVCGNKKCPLNSELHSWEVNFAYKEGEERKNTLVKLRLCPKCSKKLNYHHRRKEILPSQSTKQIDSLTDQNYVDAGETSNGDVKTSTASSQQVSSSVSHAPGEGKSAWIEPIKTENKSREDEFDEYFSGMFL